MGKKVIAQVSAAIILVLAVVSLMFGQQIGITEPSSESFAFLGIIIGAAVTFLFQTNNKTLSNVANG